MEGGKEHLGARLRQLRLAKGLTVVEVAERVGVATSTYREWEYGRAIRGEPYLKLCEVLGVTVWELISGSKVVRSKALREIDKLEYHLQQLKTEIAKTL
jgi:transcriptional regulator with XRE-family HTH domain